MYDPDLIISAFGEHSSDYDGFCTACGDWTRFGDVEPDAENYTCPECENGTVIGAELLAIRCF